MSKYKRGSTSIEYLIGLIIVAVLVPIVYTSLRLLIDHNYFNNDAQDEIALYQLRKAMLFMENVNVEDGILYANYRGEQIELITSNHHLYMTPGTLIYFTDLDEGYFVIENGKVYYEYKREDVIRKRVVAHE